MNAKTDQGEGGKAAFRKYLEDHGVIRQLTRVLVGLYETPERPLIALDYIKRHLGAPTGYWHPSHQRGQIFPLYSSQDRCVYYLPTLCIRIGVEVDALRSEVQNLTRENAALKSKVESLQQEVELLQRELAD